MILGLQLKNGKVSISSHNYFVMINYNTKEKYLCSWMQNEPLFFNQKIYFIGINELGGYNQLISKGFIDRRFISYFTVINKTIIGYKTNKYFEGRSK